MNGDLNEAIDQVANHLGVTVNQLLPYFDSYAQMQGFTSWWQMLIAIGIAAVFLCCVVASVVWCLKAGEIDEPQEMIFIFGTVFFLASLFFVAYFAMQWQQWALYPDGKLVEMILGALK